MKDNSIIYTPLFEITCLHLSGSSSIITTGSDLENVFNKYLNLGNIREIFPKQSIF